MTAATGARSAWELQLREVPTEIHALVQDADDIDPITGKPIEQHVRPRAILVISGTHIWTGPAAAWLRRDNLDVLPDLADVRLGLINTPVTFRIVPDVFNVRLRARR